MHDASGWKKLGANFLKLSPRVGGQRRGIPSWLSTCPQVGFLPQEWLLDHSEAPLCGSALQDSGATPLDIGGALPQLPPGWRVCMWLCLHSFTPSPSASSVFLPLSNVHCAIQLSISSTKTPDKNNLEEEKLDFWLMVSEVQWWLADSTALDPVEAEHHGRRAWGRKATQLVVAGKQRGRGGRGARGTRYNPQEHAPSVLLPPVTPYLPPVTTQHCESFKSLIHQLD